MAAGELALGRREAALGRPATAFQTPHELSARGPRAGDRIAACRGKGTNLRRPNEANVEGRGPGNHCSMTVSSGTTGAGAGRPRGSNLRRSGRTTLPYGLSAACARDPQQLS
jgi:hypothetical protein